jgi:hypothetical protein
MSWFLTGLLLYGDVTILVSKPFPTYEQCVVVRLKAERERPDVTFTCTYLVEK